MRRIEGTVGSPIAIICLIAVLLFVIARQIRTKRRDNRSSTQLVSQLSDQLPALIQRPRTPPILVPPKVPTTPGTVDIALPKTVDTGQFARYVPFGDKREVIVRSGTALGHRYGFVRSSKRITVSGGEYDLATFEAILSPPAHQPGQPLHPEAEELYHPTYDVLYLPGTEVMIPRRPRGFSDAEVERIVQSITVTIGH